MKYDDTINPGNAGLLRNRWTMTSALARIAKDPILVTILKLNADRDLGVAFDKSLEKRR